MYTVSDHLRLDIKINITIMISNNITAQCQHILVPTVVRVWHLIKCLGTEAVTRDVRLKLAKVCHSSSCSQALVVWHLETSIICSKSSSSPISESPDAFTLCQGHRFASGIGEDL